MRWINIFTTKRSSDHTHFSKMVLPCGGPLVDGHFLIVKYIYCVMVECDLDGYRFPHEVTYKVIDVIRVCGSFALDEMRSKVLVEIYLLDFAHSRIKPLDLEEVTL